MSKTSVTQFCPCICTLWDFHRGGHIRLCKQARFKHSRMCQGFGKCATWWTGKIQTLMCSPIPTSSLMVTWRNCLARSSSKRKVHGSSPCVTDVFDIHMHSEISYNLRNYFLFVSKVCLHERLNVPHFSYDGVWTADANKYRLFLVGYFRLYQKFMISDRFFLTTECFSFKK